MQSNTQELTPNKYIKSLSIIHMTLLAGMILFGGFVLFQFSGGITPALDTNDTLLLVFPVIVVVAILASQAIFKKLIVATESKTDLKSKLVGYQTATIIKLALIEGPAFFGIVLSMTTGNTAYIAIAIVLVIYFLLQKPTLTKVERDLKLRGELRNQFNRYDEVID
ncbi:hypothetical protein [Kordia sp.]|uniref:hypothetical protein n=1 Tax=Kordia sp. TaxID=1965332 RepID=UPI003D291476